ncbi:MAG: acetate/propionate family kinase [Patescibacteria group bacterium]
MNNNILVINSGSTTLKFSVYNSRLQKLLAGNLEGIGLPGSFLSYKIGSRTKVVKFNGQIKNHQQALSFIFKNVDFSFAEIKLVGHRVAIGGHRYKQTMQVSKNIFKELKKNNELAPLHNPANMMGLAACFQLLKKAKNFAIFDTSFYKNLPDYAYTYALPYALAKKWHIRRNGFHGTSHHYVAQQAAVQLKKSLKKLNLITCHLGGGCSITAIRSGKAVDTSLGFSPLEGLVMGTRPGDLDPATIPYLMDKMKLSTKQISHLLNFQSGLIGIFGKSSDLREVLVAAGHRVPGFRSSYKYNKISRQKAKLALAVYIYRIQKYISAYAGILGKVDAIIFTAGTGERNPDVRRLIMKDLKMLRGVKVLPIHTDEQLMIAREVKKHAHPKR